ncbi:endonuclease/exonuclease/phosphatase family protein [Algibacter mikhailovii]|uniref:endonuclease/exonuclease/phosphatase family protein n=1 Tax=Algibacter mikhailovii TaxID=425498 RepID=UPI0024949F32|nr:endonuclease/exonuclease/phosphatase family protein [Algibacter mikhailovii]
MTYNIRYDSAHDGVNIWKNRKVGLTDLLQKYQPDIIGTQEGQSHQLEFMNNQLDSYRMIGDDRDNNGKSEFSAIFYNSNTLVLVNTETFWLSETPTVPSLGWDASYKRICTYGEFKTKESNERFLVFNTHLDHVGEQARMQSALLINKKLNELNPKKLPVILMGDFNCEPHSEPIKAISSVLHDGITLSKTNLIGPIGTFSGFDLNAPLNKRIDYIFVDKFIVESYLHINSKLPNGHWPSDHLPVLVHLTLE